MHPSRRCLTPCLPAGEGCSGSCACCTSQVVNAWANRDEGQCAAAQQSDSTIAATPRASVAVPACGGAIAARLLLALACADLVQERSDRELLSHLCLASLISLSALVFLCLCAVQPSNAAEPAPPLMRECQVQLSLRARTACCAETQTGRGGDLRHQHSMDCSPDDQSSQHTSS